MTDQPSVFVFVRIKFWEAYSLNVVLMAIVFRKLLYIWGTIAVLWLALAFLAFFHPMHGQDWVGTMKRASPVQWVLAAPLIIIFVVPLRSASYMINSAAVKGGIRYQFSNLGIRTETSLSTTELRWNAVLKVRETRSMFLVFTGQNFAFILPKSYIESSQDISTLRELFRAEVKTTKLLSA
jgi:hypothetical protein